jgi:GNAT superfamily N-acetyltransferase
VQRDAGEALAAAHGLVFVQQDVRDEEQWPHVVARVDEAFGRLTVLVNNAGIRVPSDEADPVRLSFAEWRNVLAVNLDGVFLRHGCWGRRQLHLPAMSGENTNHALHISNAQRCRRTLSAWGMNIRPLQPCETARVIAAGLGLSRLPREDGSFYLVAWEGERPLGHAHLALGCPAELQDVSVLEGHRRRGVASALTRAAEREAVVRGRDRLTLTVSVDNVVAQAVYRRLGYRDSGLPPRRVTGTVLIRTGPLDVDDTLLTWEKELFPCVPCE